MTAQLAFETDTRVDRGEAEPSFLVDLDGFEGPLDLLLELARRQKVDLARISVLALAEQYLVFIEQARKVRLELAADYLVMAAWLAYLKSRLLLPDPPKPEGPGAAELAEALAQRLRRLEQIRLAAEKLVNRPRLGRDFFSRGSPESIAITRRSGYEASLYDLLAAYARQRQKQAPGPRALQGPPRVVLSADAREALNRLVRTRGRLDRLRRVALRLLRRSSDAADRPPRCIIFRGPGICPRGRDRTEAGPRLRAALAARDAPRGLELKRVEARDDGVRSARLFELRRSMRSRKSKPEALRIAEALVFAARRAAR